MQKIARGVWSRDHARVLIIPARRAGTMLVNNISYTSLCVSVIHQCILQVVEDSLVQDSAIQLRVVLVPDEDAI